MSVKFIDPAPQSRRAVLSPPNASIQLCIKPSGFNSSSDSECETVGYSREIFEVFHQLLELSDRQNHSRFLSCLVCNELKIYVFHARHSLSPGNWVSSGCRNRLTNVPQGFDEGFQIFYSLAEIAVETSARASAGNRYPHVAENQVESAILENISHLALRQLRRDRR